MMRARDWLLVLTIGVPLHAAAPIRDEAVRRQILTTLFPQMQISALSGKVHPSNKPTPGELIFFPDAMAGERLYRIIGPPSSAAEECASEDVLSRIKSYTRELSFIAFRWPRRSDVLAVLQYEFIGIGPALACPSIGRLVHLVSSDGGWRIAERIEFDTQHHGGFERIEFTDWVGNGIDQLLAESDWGGAGTAGSSLFVYSLEDGRFEQWLKTTARVESINGSFTQVLDIPKTRAKNGMAFCFTKTELTGSDGEPYRKSIVSWTCYPKGTGAELK